jgi:glycosyltransferase involved in cell wall biosynthesis
MILFLGQHYKYKGYRELLKSTKNVWDKFPNTYFVFIGPQYKDAKMFFNLFKNDKRIISLGFVNLDDKTNAMASCDIFCLPSTQESFGGVYTEAWSFKKPVIGCNIPAVSEVIDHGLNGFLINQDPQEISDKIILLLDDEKLRENFGQSGYDKVNKKYSWDKLSALTDSAYKSLVD